MATVDMTVEAQRQFVALPRVIKKRVENLIARLEKWPDVSGAKALTGDLAGRYRMRTGDYRLQFHVVPGKPDATPPVLDRVIIEKVGHRDGFYEE